MQALSLFTGVMGIDLAGEWAGIKTIAACERNEFCQSIIRKHKPGIPIYDDVCTLTRARLENDGIDSNAIRLISSGDPCQPSSSAGKRKGKNDDRHLWPETNRIIEEIRPDWVVRENVAGNITMGLDEVLTNLDDLSYTAQSFVIPASGIGADHERYRVFTIGYAHRFTKSQDNQIAHAFREKWESWEATARKFRTEASEFYRKANEPGVCRMDDGLSSRLYNARMMALGNAVNPLQIFPIIAAIKHIDDLVRAV